MFLSSICQFDFKYFFLIQYLIYLLWIISNLTKLEFVALNVFGNTYLSFIFNVKIHLDTMNFENTIKARNEASLQNRAKAMIFLCYHLYET